MKLLIIGGTVFVGRHLTEAAHTAGHSVTLLNRGKSRPEAFAEVETVHGDREDPAVWQSLAGRHFDAVVDTCGYVPRVVGIAANVLQNIVDRYVFISTISVFRDFTQVGMNETAPLAALTPENRNTETVSGETYGALKVQCEQTVADVYGDARTLVIRPGYIVGPHDPTDRFAYWVHRVGQGGDVLCPGAPDAPLQVIDARDLAEWTVWQIEARTVGTFNATGPDFALTWGRMLEACRTASGSDARFVWAGDDVLAAHDRNGGEFPLYAPATDEYRGLMQVDCGKAIEHGLTFRPLADTVADTLTWHKARSNHTFKNALPPEKEAEILADYEAVR